LLTMKSGGTALEELVRACGRPAKENTHEIGLASKRTIDS
jgi:hypothetical protein